MKRDYDIYWNLHKNCWSIINRKIGKVQLYYKNSHILIEDVQFVVQPAGNRRVRKEKRKNVHAFVRGNIKMVGCIKQNYIVNCEFVKDFESGLKRIRYNPYRNTTFVMDDNSKVYKAERVWLLDDKKVLAKF